MNSVRNLRFHPLKGVSHICILILTTALLCVSQAADDPILIKKIEAAYSQDRDSLEIGCRLEIPHPWHINSDSAALKYLISTRVNLADTGKGSHTSKIYPAASALAFFGKTIHVFSGTIHFKESFKLHKEAGFPLQAILQYQACDSKMCLPPQYHQFKIEKNGNKLQTTLINTPHRIQP